MRSASGPAAPAMRYPPRNSAARPSPPRSSDASRSPAASSTPRRTSPITVSGPPLPAAFRASDMRHNAVASSYGEGAARPSFAAKPARHASASIQVGLFIAGVSRRWRTAGGTKGGRNRRGRIPCGDALPTVYRLSALRLRIVPLDYWLVLRRTAPQKRLSFADREEVESTDLISSLNFSDFDVEELAT